MCWRLNECEATDDCMFCSGSGRKWSFAEGNHAYTIWRARPRASLLFIAATGASITGAAWCSHARFVSCGARALYCDTDSNIAAGDCSLPLSDTELGKWKVEANADCIAIGGKKMYCLYTYNESDKNERVKLPNGRWAWVVKKANKGVRLTGSQLLRVAMGETVSYASPVPLFKRSGEIALEYQGD